MPTTTRSFRLSTDLEARLLSEAARLERPVSWVIVKTLEAALDPGPAASNARTMAARTSESPAMARQRKLNEAKARKR